MSGGRIAVVLALGVSAGRGLDGRRNLEVDERCTQVQPGAPRDDGRVVRADELVDGLVCEQGELAADMVSERSRTAMSRVGSAGWFVRIGRPR